MVIMVVKMKRKSFCQSLALPTNGNTAHGRNEVAGTPSTVDIVAYVHSHVVHTTSRRQVHFNPLSTMPNEPPPLPPRNYLVPAMSTSENNTESDEELSDVDLECLDATI